MSCGFSPHSDFLTGFFLFLLSFCLGAAIKKLCMIGSAISVHFGEMSIWVCARARSGSRPTDGSLCLLQILLSMMGVSVSECYTSGTDEKVPDSEKSSQMADLCILFNILYIKHLTFRVLSHCRIINKELQKPSAPSPPTPSLGTKAAAGLLACSPCASFPLPFLPGISFSSLQ